MKFYSYSNKNNNYTMYTMAVSLENVQSIRIGEGSGKSVIRYDVSIDYTNGRHERLPYLYEDEAKKIYKEILELINK